MGFKMIINAPVGPAPRWSLNFNEQVLAFALADFNLVFGSPLHVHHSLQYKNIYQSLFQNKEYVSLECLKYFDFNDCSCNGPAMFCFVTY